MSPPVFQNHYVELPDHFYEKVSPAEVPSPELIRINDDLARDLGLDPEWLRSSEGLGMLSGNSLPAGANPIAQAYAGHQFGGWVPQLGDGRAVLLGEVIHRDGEPRDIQLKGAGRTPFSRGGDGKSPLGPVIREYLVSESMAALGVPTTRALAAVSTGEKVYREEVLPGAVFTRVASSHVRVGTFQFFYAREDVEALKSLAAFVIGRHYPEAGEAENQYEALLAAVIRSQASLIARWMQIGFIHGVMNTDNMTISGETIDYGPCAFMDRFDPETVFSSIDRQGRYAWINQPVVANWNLARFAETLLSLLAPERDEAVAIAEAHLKDFQAIFEENYFTGFAKKLSLDPAHGQVRPFVEKTLGLMADAKVDFTGFFTELTRFCRRSGNGEQPEGLPSASGWEEWWAEWQELRKRDEATWEAMRLSNPVRLPRNHRVEEAIFAATAGDFSMFHRCVEAWKHPFEEDIEFEDFEFPPTPEERVTETFCGT